MGNLILIIYIYVEENNSYKYDFSIRNDMLDNILSKMIFVFWFLEIIK